MRRAFAFNNIMFNINLEASNWKKHFQQECEMCEEFLCYSYDARGIIFKQSSYNVYHSVSDKYYDSCKTCFYSIELSSRYHKSNVIKYYTGLTKFVLPEIALFIIHNYLMVQSIIPNTVNCLSVKV